MASGGLNDHAVFDVTPAKAGMTEEKLGTSSLVNGSPGASRLTQPE